MMKRLAFPKIKQDNSGSAIITVVVTMLFVVALGTALLYAAYLGLRVSVIARSDRSTFYDASAAMDEIKTGVQNEVSAALKSAYTSALVKYGQDVSASNEFDAQKYLEQQFIVDLGHIDGATNTVATNASAQATGAFDSPVSSTAVTVKMNTANLSRFLSNPSLVTVSATGAGTDGLVTATWDPDAATLTVKGLKVRYISTDDYESDVSTDLVVSVPDFFTGAAVDKDFGDYAIVAEQGILGQSDKAAIDGGVWAGKFGGTGNYKDDSIRTNGTGDTFSITGGNIVTTGTVEALDSSSLTLDAGAYDIWTGELVAGKKSNLSVAGTTYVANDLVIGGGSSVALSGTYYGFGYDDAASTSATRDATSSSVFVNSYEKGDPAKLDVSKLDMLTLAGVSFINTTSTTSLAGGSGVSIATGQSVAVKTDQLAYLVPADCITNYKTNPAYVKKADIVAPTINKSLSLWNTGTSAGRSLSYYLGASGQYGQVVTYYTQTAGEYCTVYFFLSFTNQAKANEYFRDYITYRPQSIEQYLDVYLGLSDTTSMTAIAKGNTYSYNSKTSTWGTVSGTSSTALTSLSKNYTTTYAGRCASPMSRYVYTDALSALKSSTLYFKDGSGKTVAVVASNDYDFDSGESGDIRVIIAGGDVTIQKDYQGVVFARGTLTVNQHSLTGTAYTNELLTASCNGVPLSTYLKGSSDTGAVSSEENMWSPDKLVYYNNWQKD